MVSDWFLVFPAHSGHRGLSLEVAHALGCFIFPRGTVVCTRFTEAFLRWTPVVNDRQGVTTAVGGWGRIHLFLALVIRPLTIHPLRDGAWRGGGRRENFPDYKNQDQQTHTCVLRNVTVFIDRRCNTDRRAAFVHFPPFAGTRYAVGLFFYPFYNWKRYPTLNSSRSPP